MCAHYKCYMCYMCYMLHVLHVLHVTCVTCNIPTFAHMITLYVISVFHIYTKWPDVGILCVLYIYPRISPPVREACSLQTRYMSMYSMSHHHTQCHIIIHSVRGAYSMQTRHFCIFIHTYIHICIHSYIHTYIRMLERERERERDKFIDNQIDD